MSEESVHSREESECLAKANQSSKGAAMWIATLAVLAAIGAGTYAFFLWVDNQVFLKEKEEQQKMAMMAKMPPPAVRGVKVEKVPVVEPFKYVGRVEAEEEVEITARVEGVIEQIHFTEGALVEKGDLLFTLESDTYEADVALAEAVLLRATAAVTQAENYLNRLKKADKRTISQQDLDDADSDFLKAQAELKQAEAQLRVAKLNLSYTVISAPATGRIGQKFYSEGNLVNPGSGVLARIVQVDPIRVVFSATDRDYLESMKKQAQGLFTGMRVTLELADGSVYDKEGRWSFVDNQMDGMTGTIAIRAQFDNPDKRLIPGSFVKVLIAPSEVEEAVAVPLAALVNDADGPFVYTVNGENTVQMKRLALKGRVGAMQIIGSGLETGEQVIVEGLQKVRPGAPVKFQLMNGGASVQ